MTNRSDLPAGAASQAGYSLLGKVEAAERAFLSGRRDREKDPESSVVSFLGFLRGFESFDFTGPYVTAFGSARLPEGHPYHELSRGGFGLGCNVQLPREQRPNPYLDRVPIVRMGGDSGDVSGTSSSGRRFPRARSTRRISSSGGRRRRRRRPCA